MTFEQSILEKSSVLVAGCGALGNEVLKNLALSGVGHIVCVDFDVVELGNLSRSVLFRKKDCGRRKVDVVKERLEEINPAIVVEKVYGNIAFDIGLGLWREMDAVVSCVDSRWARFMINRHCMRTGRPWVDGAIDALECTARVFMPGENCYACSLGPEGLAELRRRMPCSNTIRRMEMEGSVPTTSISASVAGAVVAQEVLKILCGKESICGRMFYYEGEKMSSRMVEFAAYDENCPEHERWEPLELSGKGVDCTVRDFLGSIGETDDCFFMLRDDCFVDYIQKRNGTEKYRMMLSGRKIEEAMSCNDELAGARCSDFYESEYRRIDCAFPYMDLTLGELGIPGRDILPVFDGKREYYLELK